MTEKKKEETIENKQSVKNAQVQQGATKIQQNAQQPSGVVRLRYSGFWVRGAAHIIDGRVKHALLLEVFSDEGVGTLISG